PLEVEVDHVVGADAEGSAVEPLQQAAPEGKTVELLLAERRKGGLAALEVRPAVMQRVVSMSPRGVGVPGRQKAGTAEQTIQPAGPHQRPVTGIMTDDEQRPDDPRLDSKGPQALPPRRQQEH